MTQQTIEVRDLVDALSRQRDEAMNALASAQAMLAKTMRESEHKDRQIADLTKQNADLTAKYEPQPQSEPQQQAA